MRPIQQYERVIYLSAVTAIKQRLKELDMSQTELAKAIGTTRQNLANKMSRDNFSAIELCSIGDALGLTLIFKDNKNKEYAIKYVDESSNDDI